MSTLLFNICPLNSTSMKHLQKWWTWAIGLILVWLIICVWPIRWALAPNFINQTHLVLLMNEAEARPCGGFTTAYGTIRLFPTKFNLKNIYDLSDFSFGNSLPPLDKIAPELKFWDLGASPDSAICSNVFHEAANKAGIDHDRVILVNISLAETILDDPNFFARMSRTVANTDRHDEDSLAARKSPLASLGKKIIFRTILRPWRWAELTREINAAVQTGELYISGVSPEIRPKANDIVLTEWNLGGGKSSRFLDKTLDISAREIQPDVWRLSAKLNIEHLGQYDEPLSQIWKGGMEIHWPSGWDGKTEFIEMELNPGEKIEKQWAFELNGKLQELSVFVPRGQKLHTNFKLSLFGQQTFNNTNLITHENVGTDRQTIGAGEFTWHWETIADETKPFVTLHEWLSMDSIPTAARKRWSTNFTNPNKRFSVAEIHFSEPIQVVENLGVKFRDKNHENKEITNDPYFEEFLLWSGNQTALIGFWQEIVQPNERFAITLYGLTDSQGNPISDKEYTLIDRTK